MTSVLKKCFLRKAIQMRKHLKLNTNFIDQSDINFTRKVYFYDKSYTFIDICQYFPYIQ